MGIRVDELEELVATRVADVDAGPFDQRTPNSQFAAPAFLEAETTLIAQAEARPLGHLRFEVLAGTATPTDDRQRPGEDCETLSTVVVSYLYRVRAGKDPSTDKPYQRQDKRLAARAAAAIVRAVKALPQSRFCANLIDGWSPAISADGEWLLVAVTFSILFDMPV